MTSYATSPANEANWEPESHAFALRVGKVVAVNDDDHTVDVTLVQGGLVFKATVLEMWAGSDYGDIWSPQFTPDPGVPEMGIPAEAWRQAPQERRDAYCLLAFANGRVNHPFVLGFFYPEISQMMIRGFQRLTRYVGDTFSAVSRDGDQWIAFDQSGGFVSFHNPGTARPPDLTQKDYDRRAFTRRRTMSFTVMLANGSHVSLDGTSGNVIIGGPEHVEIDATRNLGLYGGPITARGFEDLWLTRRDMPVAGQCMAPFSEDDTVDALNLCVNAAYDRRADERERASAAQGGLEVVTDGWRFLGDGDAARVEIGPDGRIRHFSASGLMGAPIAAWTNPTPHYNNVFVPLNFPTPGIQRFVVPPERFIVTGVQAANANAWTSSIGNPTTRNPAILAAGTVVTIEVLSISGTNGAQISLWGNRG